MTRAAAFRSPKTLFTLGALGIVTVCTVLVRSQAFGARADVVAWGATFDLTITIPLLYWLFVVRPGLARPLTLAPVFVGCMMVAALVLPRGEQFFLHDLRFVSAPLELVTLALLGRRIARLRQRDRTSDDPYARIASATRELLGDNRAAEFVASEITILYYALCCWRKRAERPAGSFTVHERSGWGSIVACFLVLLFFESIGAHLFAQAMWGAKWAWLVTALDVYGILWIVGDYHALRLRPSFADEDALHLRYGLRWSVTIPRTNIASVTPIASTEEWKRRDVLKMALLDEPRLLVTLHEPVIAHGIAGLQKRITAVALLPDQDVTLVA